MPPLLIAAPESLSGKTTVAVAIGQRLKDAGRTVTLLRLAGGDHAAEDARLFAGLAFNANRLAEPVQAEAVAVTFPNYVELMRGLGGRLEVSEG